ncbi:pancreatic progenitor cell differentiation and proliferation factor-like protein [Lepisosteus oculatus]|uniref:pancreatic progenitor cell differentiation and proliferation factor-like protein n=1 Tax=Lepisosteus oculatus TaxID=7918 RepID=UPI003718138A
MASVPSAGCLLARNQFYRTRLNSTSSNSSTSSSSCDYSGDHEKAPVSQGIQVPFEKCWWLKNFFVCEAHHQSTSEPPTSSSTS